MKAVARVLKDAAVGWVHDNAMRLSAALSLYTILSLAPLLVILIKIVGLILRNKDVARTQIMTQLTSLMGESPAHTMGAILDRSAAPGNGVFAAILSSAVLLFSATGVFIELQDSMNTIWGVEAKPRQGLWGFVRNRLLSLAMVFGVGFLLLVSMFLSTVLTTLAHRIAGNNTWLAFVGDIVVSLGFITLLFAGIFKFLPDVKLRWRHVWLGALITSLLFIVGKYALALYFKYATPTSVFGAAGSLMAVLLWVYYSGFILFFGAEFTKAWVLHEGDRVEPAAIAVKVADVQPPGSTARFRIRAPHPTRTCANGHPRLHAGTLAALASGFATGVGAAWVLWKKNPAVSLHEKAVSVSGRLNAIDDRLRRAARRQ